MCAIKWPHVRTGVPCLAQSRQTRKEKDAAIGKTPGCVNWATGGSENAVLHRQ